MTQSSKLADASKKQRRELNVLKHKEQLMKYGLWGAGIVILLLLLVLGWATDWTKGLHKDSSVTPNSSLDASKSTEGSASGDAGTASETGTNNTATETGGGTTTDRTTTNNSTTTTNNTTTTTDNTSQPSNGLLSLYSDSNAGRSVNEIIDQAQELGITTECHTEIVVQVCTFIQDGYTIVTKNISGIDGITSITKNF